MRHPIRNLIFAGLLFLASGSLLSASSESNSQHAVDAALRQHVQAGVTEAAQVISRFGEPSTRQPRRGPGESEVLGYHHDALVPPRFPLLPLISFPSTSPADTFFEVTDGVVTRYWTTM
jgi:hypothetical protein